MSQNSSTQTNTPQAHAPQTILQGKVWRFGANIDTDVIIAARYLNTSDEMILAKHIMEDARAGFAELVSQGDIIVADENFGCGSSREHAPLALKAAGIACVIAPSFARIFYRNAFNMGLLILECDSLAQVQEGDTLHINLQQGTITHRANTGKDSTHSFKPIPAFMLELLESGGLIQYAKKQLS